MERSDLRDQREATLREVFAFLDVNPDFRSTEFNIEFMSRDDYLRYGALGWRLRASVLGRAYRRLPLRQRLAVSRTVRRLVHAVPQPKLDPDLHAALAAFLAPELERVRSMTCNPLTRRLAAARR